MKKFDPNYVLLKEMYNDEYYPAFLVDKVKAEIQKVIELLESGENDVEIIHIAGEGGDQVRSEHEDDVRHGDLREDLPPVGTVDLRRLILIGRNVLQNTSDLHDGVRNTDPQVDDDYGDTGPSGVGEERQRTIDPTPRLQHAVHRALRLEHGVHDQQGHELRNGDGHGEAGAPETLEVGGLAVDDHGHEHAEEEVQESGEEGPDQCPHQHTSEQCSVNSAAAVGENLGEVLKADPVEQHEVLVVIAGECH